MSHRRARRAACTFLLIGATSARMAFAEVHGGETETAPRAPKLTRPPKLLKFVEASYPESESAQGRSATVVLQIGITATGEVNQVAVTQSAGAAFDAAAMAAARQFVFEPAEIDDKPAPIRILYRYEFVLRRVPIAQFGGTVRDRTTKKPLSGVTITVDNDKTATTDADGRFQFGKVPPGKHVVSLSGERMTALQTEEVLEDDQKLDATYEIDQPAEGGEADDLDVVAIAPPLEKHVVSTEVSADQATRVPGTQGDVLKVVESMPGVGRSSVGSGQLVVWGAAPEDTRVYVDGVRIPVLYHNGGIRSVIHSDLVASVQLVPGAYGSTYGRGLGGLVTVQLSPLDKEGFHGSAAADLLDASASARARVAEKWSVEVAGRRSYLDWVLARVTTRDVGDLFPIPRYYDGQARIAYRASSKETVEIGGLLSSDEIDRTVTSADPARFQRELKQMSFQRLYLRYTKRLEDGSDVTIVPSFGADRTRLVNRFGTTPTELRSSSNLYGLRAVYQGHLGSTLILRTGMDAELVRTSVTRVGSVTAPAREGDVHVFGQAPSDQVNGDDWSTVTGSLSPYGEADVSLLAGKLHLVPGIRLEPFFTSASRRTPIAGDTPSIGLFDLDTVVEPRISVSYQPAQGVLTKAGWGIYHQSPLPEDLSAVFGSPTLGVASAMHWLLGAEVQVSNTVSIETTGFYSKSRDLSVRSDSPSPLLAQALVGDGRGRAYGTQVLLRKALSDRFFGWVSYSILRSERANGPDASYRLFDFDQTHVLTALASYDLGRGFEVGARVRYATGFPRTPVARAYDDSRSDAFVPVFGRQNTIRIPPFVQGDVRLAKRFDMGTSRLELYLDVQNVTNRTNSEEILYNADYSQRRYITGLPILPVVGAKWTW